ncbi:hypothetical protein Trydic_g23732 [Trypoxylus dichotomus]
MILRRKGLTLFYLLLLQLALSSSQNARSYDTSDWIPISQPCSDCKTGEQVVEKKTTGRVLNLPQKSGKEPLVPNDYRNVRQTNNYQQYLADSATPVKQKHRSNVHQTNPQFDISQNPQLSPAQLQQAYTRQHLLPNIDLITRQVLQQSQKIVQQIQPTQNIGQNPNQYQVVPQQIYNPGALPQNLLKQSYPSIPHQFVLPQQLQQVPSPQLYQQQGFVQQSQLQNYQPVQLQNQQLQQTQNATHYENSGIQNLNQELLNVANEGYKNIDITSTTPKAEKENVQLLYVPLEHLQQKQQAISEPSRKLISQSQKRHRQKPVTEPLRKENLLEGIEQDFIQQALQAHRLQQELDQQGYYSPSTFVTAPQTTTTLKPVSRKRKPHQPPLAVYMNGAGTPKVTDVLNALKDVKTIDVQDTIGPESPHVFVGPANLDPPDGFSKFDLPYLSNIESNRIERKVDQLPFFVAPLNYKAPPGYSKIPFPSPHVGSVVINNNELERNIPLETVPSVEDFLSPYNTVQLAQTPDVKKEPEAVNLKAAVQEETPTYQVRKPSRTRGRQQQTRGRTHSNIVAQQSVQASPAVNYINGYETVNNKQNAQSLYNTNAFPAVSSTAFPDTQTNANLPNVEINNPSLNLSNQFQENEYLTVNNGNIPNQRLQQNLQPNKQIPPEDLDKYEQVTPSSKQKASTPEYVNNFEIVPSISSTVNPYSGKDAVQNFFQQEFQNFPVGSSTPATNFYEAFNSKTNGQNGKHSINENIGDVFSIIPTASGNKQTSNDRRYLPLDSKTQVPPPQVDYDEIFQLPVGQVNTNQKHGPSSVSEESYKILDEYSLNPSAKQENTIVDAGQASQEQANRQQVIHEQVPVRQSTRQRTRGRISQTTESQKQYISPQQNQGQIQGNPQENYESHSISNQQQLLAQKDNSAQSVSNFNNYQNDYQQDNPNPSPIANPVLPGLINSLEDPSIRQLLTPILLAPPEKLANAQVPISTPQPTQGPIVYDHFTQTTVPSLDYNNYEQLSTTTSTEASSTTQAHIVHVETTTQRRQRNRGRGSSRYNDRTTSRSPTRNPNKIRTQHPSRNRFRQTSTTTSTTTEAYFPVKQHIYTTTTTTEAPRRATRQRFRTRGRPLQTEYYTSSPKLVRIPETTTPQVVTIPAEEQDPKIEIQHAIYEEQPVRKPQLITRSKILTPEEEYLVNKYNLQVTTIEDPVTENIENINVHLINQNVPSDPEQKLDNSKTIQVQQTYSTTAAPPIITEIETTTRPLPTKHRFVPHNHHVDRNLVRTEHTPIKIRTRIRTRKTTQRPTTTSTTTLRNEESSPSSLEEQEQEFYGFFRQPVFSQPTVETTVKTPHDENSLYNPIIIGHQSKADLYEDEDVETNDEGIQIFANNQQSPSTPVHFIGQILPKQATTEKYYEATFEPLPAADRFVSLTTSTTTEKTKRRTRIPLRESNTKLEATRTNEVQAVNEVTRRTPQRTRTRGRSHFKNPQGVVTEKPADSENYPQLYLKAKSDNQQYTPQTVQSEVAPPNVNEPESPAKLGFQITIDPAEGEDENEDQEPYSSILRPKIILASSNHWNEDLKVEKTDKEVGLTTEADTTLYDTTTEAQNNAQSTIRTTKGEAITTQKPKKRGYWKLVKLRKVVDDFEAEESQNVGVVSVNMYDTYSKDKDKNVNVEFTNEENDFVNSLYNMYRLTTLKPESETVIDSTETSIPTTTESSLMNETVSSEVPTTATPAIPAELETTTTENYQDFLYDVSLDDDSDLDNVAIKEDDGWNLGFIETSTSTSTEVSHETEICFKGVCVKSNEMQ